MVGGVVANFDLGERFPRPRSQQRGSLRPRARRVGGRFLPLTGSEGVITGNFFLIFLMPNPAFVGNLGQKIN